MPLAFESHRESSHWRVALASRLARFLRPRLVINLAMFGALAVAQQAPNPCKSIHPPVLTDPPDANRQMEMREQAEKDRSAEYSAANVERRKQISEDSSRLLKLAAELKTEVDKTSKDTLSLGIIRKADEIERLAHGVKEKMKLTMGGN